jgi:hypothetical protein
VDAPPTVTVTFEESESVTTTGTTKTTYLVLHDRVWLPPQRLADAQVEQLPRIPQVIWRRKITVRLAMGTPVERLTSRPQIGRGTTADVLLGKAKGLRQQTRRDTYQVGRRGELVRP